MEEPPEECVSFMHCSGGGGPGFQGQTGSTKLWLLHSLLLVNVPGGRVHAELHAVFVHVWDTCTLLGLPQRGGARNRLSFCVPDIPKIKLKKPEPCEQDWTLATPDSKELSEGMQRNITSTQIFNVGPRLPPPFSKMSARDSGR